MRDRRSLLLAALLTITVGPAVLTAAGQDPLPSQARPSGRASSRSAPSVPAARAAREPSATATTTTTEAAASTSFTVGAVDLHAFDAEADLPDGTRSQVLQLLDRYLDRAVVAPLRSGQPAGDLSAVFAGAALERMSGPDRAALVDEGLPPAQQVRVTAAEADLTALVGPAGIQLMTAGIKVVVTGAVDGAPLTVERTGELLLNADGDEWRVTGYRVRVSRDTNGPVTATTVRP